MTPAPDSAAREAARQLDQRKRLREIDEALLARAPENDVDPSLAQITAVMELLGDPQRTFPVIHITGTNGKTSTARIIESVLRELGLRTGRFTSPHLHDVRERISIDGAPIDPERFIAAYDDVIPYVEMVDGHTLAAGGAPMNYFQTLVAVAYAAFADAPVDVAVIEVGLGGRWDATNVADGAVAVVGPVSLDHTRLLGDSVEEIAGEKAGIIKADARVVSAVQEPDVATILLDAASEVGASVAFDGVDFGVTEREVAIGGQLLTVTGLAATYPELFLPLHGPHQAHNAALAVAAVESFVGGGEQLLDIEVLRAGLAAATSPGRLEIVRRSPTVIVDAAHNPHGAQALAEALKDSFAFGRLVGVLAVFADKDATGILETLEPVLDEVVVTRNTSPRAMDPGELGALAAEIFGEHRVTVVRDLPDALDRAAELADEGGVNGGIVATGSVVTAAEVRMLLGQTSA